jgi:hypothetical protein
MLRTSWNIAIEITRGFVTRSNCKVTTVMYIRLGGVKEIVRHPKKRYSTVYVMWLHGRRHFEWLESCFQARSECDGFGSIPQNAPAWIVCEPKQSMSAKDYILTSGKSSPERSVLGIAAHARNLMEVARVCTSVTDTAYIH